MRMFSKIFAVGIAIALAACSVNAVTFRLTPVTIGGTITGLDGTGLVLTNNGTDDLAISGNGAFAFTTAVESGASYAVEVKSQPSNPTQMCSVTNGNGTAGDEDVTGVQVSCRTIAFSVGGTVTGLAGAGLVLQNNAGDNLAVNADGTFSFATPVPSGASYDVTVAMQPSLPTQACTVTNGTGTVVASNVTSVRVTCVGWSLSLFPIAVPGSDYGVGDLDLDNSGDLLVVVSNPARAIVRVNHVTGAQTTVATGIGTGFLLGVAYRAANDMIYAHTDDGHIFAVTPTGTVTLLATVSAGLHAITIAPPSFGSFGGFIIGVNQSGSVVAVNPADGAVTTITAAAGAASDLAFAPDGTLYISGGATVRTVTVAGVVTLFTSSLSSADGITIAPDGTRMFIADSGLRAARQVTIPGAVVTTVGPASVNGGTFVGGILAAPGNTLIVLTDTNRLSLVAFPY